MRYSPLCSWTACKTEEAFPEPDIALLEDDAEKALFQRVLAYEPLFRGTINATSVYPRVVVQRVLELNAAAVVFAHQHPSGVSEPSSADRMLTQQLQAALALIDVRVLDHIIVGQGAPFSFAESGLL